MIIFNFNAILQIVIVAIIFLLMHAVFLLFGFDMTESTSGSEMSLLFFISIISVYTEIMGIKGRLFFIPLWIFSLIVILILNNTRFSIHHSDNYSWYVLAIVLLYLALSWVILTRRFNRSKLMLELLINQNHLANPTEYWNIAAAAYFRPPYLFIKAYSLWKLIKEPVFSGHDFVEHYGTLLSLEGFRAITAEPYNDWIPEIKSKIEHNTNFSSYQNHERDLKRIAQIIERTQKLIPSDQTTKF